MRRRMKKSEIYVEAILLSVLSLISETKGIPEVFKLINPVLQTQSLEKSDFSKKKIAELNNSFGHSFSDILQKSKTLLNRYGIARRPRLSDLSMSPELYSSDVQVIPFLIYANIMKTEGCLEVLEICDKCCKSSGFELITCGIQIIQPGCEILTHRGMYHGFQMYYVVLQGNSHSFITISGQKHSMITKSSVLFGAEMPSSLRNDGKEDLILIGCELMKPMDITGAVLNSIVLKIMADSTMIKNVCENAWIE
jgi:hypothetical protein